ncbi:MAG: VIT1/CCC1 transporter family protein [Candidatus Lokiarchaeota archaeon]|nr:VIT1/CCC1 transporter family protein [Candidatus Harpocratesius repetitus]
MSKPYQDELHLTGGEIIRQVTFGMNDGVVSIFALLAGVAGADQTPKTILITLLAATIAGALSMAAGEFISGKSERDYYKHEIAQERLEIHLTPEIEKEEIRLIYKRKGFRGDLLDQIVNQIIQDEDRWVREMVIEELGVTDLEPENPLKNSIVIFFAFILGALFPVLPYAIFQTLLSPSSIFWVATAITFGGLFLAGALKKFVTGVNWFKSGIEMLAVGLFAYGISYLLGTLVGVAI